MEFLALFPPLTLGFIAVVFCLTVYFHGPSYSSHTANNAPAVLTGIGIFGTFLGIAIGLLNFDASNIEQGVPALMDGLKTAFWSSIAGLLGALSVKFRHVMHVIRYNPAKANIQAATIDDLANSLDSIRKALSCEEQGGIQQQLIQSREDSNQRLETLTKEFADYQDKVTEANTKAFVTALESVLKDFNAQIDVQYGDNFKQLNEAVGNMACLATELFRTVTRIVRSTKNQYSSDYRSHYSI